MSFPAFRSGCAGSGARGQTAASDAAGARSRGRPNPALRGGVGPRLATLACLCLAFVACNRAEPPSEQPPPEPPPEPPAAEVAIVNLEETTYVNDSVTFTVAVVGGAYDSLELRRDGELFQVLAEPSFTWDVSGAPERSYTFVARLRRGPAVVDSAPRVVVVDRTAPSVSLAVTPDPAPLIAGTGRVELAATTEDDVLLERLELLDGDEVLASDAAGSLDLTLTPERGSHDYRARAVDRAGNVALSAATTVPVYVREAHTLTSEAALDGCVSAGYEPQLFERHFDTASCNWTTSWSILHFFSFDRSGFPGAQVERAVLRFHREDSIDPSVQLASVDYDDADDAPPTEFVYPFESTVPETRVSLDTSFPTGNHALDVTSWVQADVAEGRQRSQLRLRTQSQAGFYLGGKGYFAEVGDERAPTLELDMLVP